MLIRQEELKDFKEIKEVVKTAFATAEHSDGNEHNLIDRLRQSDGFIKELALVAIDDNKIVGHILFTKVTVGNTTGVALAPLAVLPSAQKKGVGKALMNHAHSIARELGFPFSVVLGSENYYPKVGYKPASEFGISAPFEVPSENFMVLFLNKNTDKINGIVEYVKEMLEG